MYKTSNKLKIKEKLIIISNCAIYKTFFSYLLLKTVYNFSARLVELVDTSDLKSDFNKIKYRFKSGNE